MKISVLLMVLVLLLEQVPHPDKPKQTEPEIIILEIREDAPEPVEIPTAEPAAEVVPRNEELEYYANLELLARVINAEAGADYLDEEIKWLVGAVILNRVKSPNYPDTIPEVVYQWEPTVQYACTVDGNIEKEPTDICCEIAAELLQNGIDIPENVVYQSEFPQGSGVYKEIQGMYFSYE